MNLLPKDYSLLRKMNTFVRSKPKCFISSFSASMQNPSWTNHWKNYSSIYAFQFIPFRRCTTTGRLSSPSISNSISKRWTTCSRPARGSIMNLNRNFRIITQLWIISYKSVLPTSKEKKRSHLIVPYGWMTKVCPTNKPNSINMNHKTWSFWTTIIFSKNVQIMIRNQILWNFEIFNVFQLFRLIMRGLTN